MPLPDSQSHYLKGLESVLDDIIHEVRESFSHLDEAQLNWKPDERTWSIGQIFDHLIISDLLYLDKIVRKLKEARAKNLLAKGNFKPGIIGHWFSRQLQPNSRLKIISPYLFRPEKSHIPGSILDRFLTHEIEFRQLMADADGWDLNKIHIVSPVSRLLRFRLGDTFNILLTHQRRHLAQARRILAALTKD